MQPPLDFGTVGRIAIGAEDKACGLLEFRFKEERVGSADRPIVKTLRVGLA